MKPIHSIIARGILFGLFACAAKAGQSGDFAYEASTSNPSTIKITGYTGAGGQVSIPETIDNLAVTSIGDNAFQGQAAITGLTLPGNVTTIGSWAFASCSGLSSLDLPANVISMGEFVFAGCTGLTNLSLPDNTTGILRGEFAGCAGLTSLTLPTQVTYIADNSFENCTGLTNILFSTNLVTIGTSAFSGCAGLANLTLPDSLTTIEGFAFQNCSGLKSIILSTNLTSPWGYAFSGCSGLRSLIIPSGVTELQEHLFAGCSSLASLYFLGNAPSVSQPDPMGGGGQVFGSTTAIYYLPGTTGWGPALNGIPTAVWGEQSPFVYVAQSANTNAIIVTKYTQATNQIIIPAIIQGMNVVGIGDYAFSDFSGPTNITLPNSVTNIGPFAFAECAGLKNITVASDNPAYSDQDGVLMNKAQTALLLCPMGRQGSYSIPKGVITVEANACYGCAGLTSLTIPNSVMSLGNAGFRGCAGLKSIAFGNSVTTVGDETFSGCSGLTNLALPDSVTSIGISSFANCSGLTNIDLGNGLQTIIFHAFTGCTGLTRLILPASVTDIYSLVFDGCTNLTRLYFEGNAPSIASSAFDNARITSLYYLAATTGWNNTLGGIPTSLWWKSYSQWVAFYGLADKFPNASGEQDDADGDGMTNVQEMNAGTDPTNAQSTLAFESSARPDDLSEADKSPKTANQFALYFQSVPGKYYDIKTCENVGDSWSTVTTFAATTTQKRLLLDKPATRAFYRVMLHE